MQEACTCPIRAWDMCELGDDKDAISDFSKGISLGNFIANCKTWDEISSKLMDVSLTHDIVAFNVTKNHVHTWSILGIGLVKTTKDTSNIDADVIESIVEIVKDELTNEEMSNDLNDAINDILSSIRV